MAEPKTSLDSKNEILSSFISKDIVDPGLDQNLMTDPLYDELLVHYQNAEWVQCHQIIDTLLAKYPHSRKLIEFKSDIEMQSMLHSLGTRDVKDRVRSGVKKFLIILSIVLVIIGLAGVVLTQMANAYVRNLEIARIQAAQTQKNNLQSLENQARLSINAGQPDSALGMIAQIESIDPNYPAIANLHQQASDLSRLVHLYDEAMLNMSAKKYSDALVLFKQIQEKDPSFRDVPYQVSLINRNNHLQALLTQANSTYQKGLWLDTIRTLEEAISIDTSVQTPEIKDELLYSYLKSIVETLSKTDPTIPELERSGEFYQKAISLIPQNRNYLAARENLQQLSLELLITKYFQTAKFVLRDPRQSEQAVAQAVGFLRKSLELKPDNQPVKAELEKAIIYQKAYSDFNLSKFDSAIKSLNNLIKFDQNYPNGMGQVLLYEAYSLQGQKYLSGGFYLDARANLEQAEIIAWGPDNNKMRLFQVQINLGYTFGKLENYKDAVSYFDFALKSSNALTSMRMDPDFTSAIQQGQSLNQQGKYQEAYKIYVEALKKLDKLYKFTDVQVMAGDSLVYIANFNKSTISAIRQYNNVDFPSATRSLTLSVPSLP